MLDCTGVYVAETVSNSETIIRKVNEMDSE